MKKRMKKAMAGMSQTAQAAGILNETLKAQLTAEQLRDAGKMTSAMEGSYSKEDINTIVHAMFLASETPEYAAAWTILDPNGEGVTREEFYQKLVATGKELASLEMLAQNVPALGEDKQLQLEDFVATLVYLRRNSPIFPPKAPTPTQYLSSDTDEPGSIIPTPVRQKKAATPIKSVRTPVSKPVLSTPVASFRSKPPTPSGLKSPLPPRLNLSSIGKDKSQPWIVIKDQLEEKIRGLEMELKRSSTRVKELEQEQKTKKDTDTGGQGGGFSFGAFSDFTPSLGLTIPGMSEDKAMREDGRKAYVIQTMAWNVSYSTQNVRQHAIKSIHVWHNSMCMESLRLQGEARRKEDAAAAQQKLDVALGENPIVVQLRETNLDLRKMLLVQSWGRQYLEVKLGREQVLFRERMEQEQEKQMTELKKEQYDRVHTLKQTQFDNLQKLKKEHYDNIRETHAQHRAASEKIRTDGRKVSALAQCRSVLIRAQNVLSTVCVLNWRQRTEENLMQICWNGNMDKRLALQMQENELVQSNIRNESRVGTQKIVQKQKRESAMRQMCMLMLNQTMVLVMSCLSQWKKSTALGTMKATLREEFLEEMKELSASTDRRHSELLTSSQSTVIRLKAAHVHCGAIKQWAEILLRYQVANAAVTLHMWRQNQMLDMTQTRLKHQLSSVESASVSRIQDLSRQLSSVESASVSRIQDLSRQSGGSALRRIFWTWREQHQRACVVRWQQSARLEAKASSVNAARCSARQRTQAIAIRQLRAAMLHQGASKQIAQLYLAISEWRSAQTLDARLSSDNATRRECESRVVELKQECERQVAELQLEMQHTRQNCEAQAREMHQSHEAKIAEMVQRHKIALEDISASYEEHISEIKSQHQTEVETEQEAHLALLDTLREEHKVEIENLNLKYVKSNEVAEKRRRDFYDRRATRMQEATTSTSKQAGLRGFQLFLREVLSTQTMRCITQWREVSRFEVLRQTRGLENRAERQGLLSRMSLKGLIRAMRHIQLAAMKHLIACWHIQQREQAVRSRPGITEKGLMKTIESLKSQLMTSQTLFGEQLIKLEAEKKEETRFREKSELLQDRIEILEKKIVDDRLNTQDVVDSVIGLRTTVAQLERQLLVAEEESALLKAKNDSTEVELQEVKAEKSALEERQDSSHSKVSFLANGLVDFQVKATQREKQLESRIAELEVMANRALTEISVATPRNNEDGSNNLTPSQLGGRSKAPANTRLKTGPIT